MSLVKPILVFDAEADGLLDTATKIHCLSYKEHGQPIKTVTTKEDMQELFSRDVYFAGHNVVDYDRRLIKLIYDIDVPLDKFIDTRFLSMHLNDFLNSHSLESVSRRYGFQPKVEIEDWKNLSLEEYIERCEVDTDINYKVFAEMYKDLMGLYDGDREEIHRLFLYLTYKAQAQVQWSYVGVKVDVPRAKSELETFEKMIEDKRAALIEAMPLKANYTIYNVPKTKLKKDGTPSKHYENWLKRLENDTLQILNEDGEWEDAKDVPHIKEELDKIRIVTSYEEPNPGSSHQVKEWMFSLGWKPCTFNEVREDGKVVRRIPQINDPNDKTELVESIKLLIDDNPALAELESMSTLVHRAGKLKAFLEMRNEDDRVFMSSMSLTSTMRIKHRKPLENMPKSYKPFASAIRGSIVAGEGNVLIGVDLSSIEDKTKRHFIYDLDPEYVELQESPGFDPHIDIAKLAGMVSEEDADFYATHKKAIENGEITDEEALKRFRDIDHKRDGAKTANFSCLPTDITQVKTPEGWKWRSELKVGDAVMSYDPSTDSYVKDEVLHIVDKVDEVVEMRAGKFVAESTPDHRWLVEKTNSDSKAYWTYITTDEVSGESDIINHAHQGEVTSTKGDDIAKVPLGKKEVFCITTNNSNFVMKQGGTVTITGNCTYGAGAPAVSAGAKIPLPMAESLVKTYRQRNWAVDVMTKRAPTKIVRGKTYIHNSISGFWMPLRHEKDRLSAINQSAAVYVFDTWAWTIRKMLENAFKDRPIESFGAHIPFEYHDEVVIEAREEDADKVLKIVERATQIVNDRLKLNITVGYGAGVGRTYSDVS